MRRPTLASLRRASPDSEIRVVEGTDKDIAAIDNLYRAVGWSPPGGIRRRDAFLLARRGPTLDGALLYWHERADDDLLPAEPSAPYGSHDRFNVLEIGVSPGAQRRGVGSTLMQAAAEAAVDAGAGWMVTWPSTRGSEADTLGRRAFFAACGMTEFRSSTGPLEMVATTAAVLAATEARGAEDVTRRPGK